MPAHQRQPASEEGPRRGNPLHYHKARLRRFLFTHGPDRLTRGRLSRRHLAQDVVIRQFEVSSPRWPEAWDGFRIGHVSDLHVGDLMPVDRAVEIIDVLGAQKPDLIACTGDVIDLHAVGTDPVFRALGRATARLGTLLVLGNHDELDDRRTVIRLAERAGVRVLQNEAAEIANNGERLAVAGVNWAKRMKHCSVAVAAACADDTHLLLSHNPKSFRQAARLGVPLTLAGHTHGGQIAWKNRPNANLSLTHRHRAGLFERQGSHLFVTTGAGAWFPLRVNCPAEIAVITMRSAAR